MNVVGSFLQSTEVSGSGVTWFDWSLLFSTYLISFGIYVVWFFPDVIQDNCCEMTVSIILGYDDDAASV